MKKFALGRIVPIKRQLFVAFTLSEVLITLGIIGVIASMTIPTLVKSYQKTYYVTALKKFYSSFGNNMKTYMASQDCNDMQCTGLFSGSSTDEINGNIKTLLTTKLKSTYQPKTYQYSFFTWGSGYSLNFKYRSIDGMYFNVSPYTDCSYFASAPSGAKMKNTCAYIQVDVNGQKLPNKWGMDIFDLWLGNDGGIYPRGGKDQLAADPSASFNYWKYDNIRCNPSATNTVSGEGCSGRIVEEGWQMKYNWCGDMKICPDSK